MEKEDIKRENLMDELASVANEAGANDEIYKWKKKKGTDGVRL